MLKSHQQPKTLVPLLMHTTTDPASGTLSAITDQSCQSGSPHADTAELTYTHDGSDTTSDSFTNQVCDEAASCATATVSITINPPAKVLSSDITLDPIEGPPGTVVTATGSGWSAGHRVSVQWEDGTELAVTTVDGNGGFTVSFTVPDDATEREYTINFVDAPPEGGLGYFIPDTFTVTAPSEPTPPEAQPTITLDPTEGPPGTVVTVTGSGWTPGYEGDPVELYLQLTLRTPGIALVRQ
jgi:hypothetical protein